VHALPVVQKDNEEGSMKLKMASMSRTDKNFTKQSVLQGAMIAAIATVSCKVPHQIRRQMAGGLENPQNISDDWYLSELIGIMKKVFRIEIEEGTPEYEMAKMISEVNCKTYNTQQAMMREIVQEGPIDVKALRERYGI
jgi:hypothetical protein